MVSYIYKFDNKITEPVREAYNVLRSNIGFSDPYNKVKTISVISSIPNEGKTTVAANLSISLAYSDKKVLLVDADLRKPEEMKKNYESSNKGLTDFLLGNSEVEDIVYDTNVKNLFYIPSGSKTPFSSELLDSSSFSDFVKKAKDKFDFVIVDTSSLSTAIDAALISVITDGSLLVLASGKVSRKSFISAKKQLEIASAKIIGVVLNNVPDYEYNKFFNYYSEEDSTLEKINERK